MATRTKKEVAVKELPAPVQEVAAQEPVAAPAPELKPFVVNADKLTLGDLEFMESFSQLKEGGKSPSVTLLYELFTRFFEDWTIEDCRKIPINRVYNIQEELFKLISKSVPNVKGTAS